MYVNGGMIPTFFAVQRTWVNKQFLGICDSGND